MAKVLGKSGRYVGEEATRKRHAMWTRVAIAIGGLGAIWGVMVGSSFRVFTMSLWGRSLLSVVFLLAMCLLAKWSFRRLDELDRERQNMQKGAEGEDKVGRILSELPGEFRVINDLPTRRGNLDHVVIGPTGVYVIDTKSCRGVISADGKGELMLNGKPSSAAHVNGLVARMMEVRERVQALAPNVDAYFRAVLVFTCAWVDADFGKTGKAHCVRDDQLKRYLEDGKRGKSLSADQVEVLARAFAGLAQMEPEFTAQMGFRPGEEVVAGRQVGSLGNGSHVAESLDGCAVSAGG